MNRLKLACATALAGRDIVRAHALHYRSLSPVEKSGFRDLKTVADEDSEGEIVRLIRRHFPKDRIYAEESWKEGQVIHPEDTTWVVDPVDGTTNLTIGLPLVAVSIGVRKAGNSVIGVVADVFNEKLYYADASHAAVSAGGSDQMLTSGLHTAASRQMIFFDTPASDRRIHVVAAFLEKAIASMQPPRILGCAVLALCFVAEGKAGGYVNAQLHDWDVAGALPILEHCGCTVTDWLGNPWQPHGRPHGIIVGTSETHPQLLEWARTSVKETGINPADV
jgi:myo-inositol-1(or 4)-monophosphatase